MRKALGKGLEVFFPDSSAKPDAPVKPVPISRDRLIPVDRIRASRTQPRQRFDEETLSALTESLRRNGMIQPLLVREHGEGFELIAGERRWRAARKAGLETVPAVVREATDEESFELALIENVQREDLSPLEEAEAYRRLVEEYSLTQEQIASRVGKNRATVANLLRLLGLPEEIKERIANGELSMGHARALLSAPPDRQIDLARDVVDRGLSVRETERLASVPKYKRRSKVVSIDVHVRALEEELCRLLGTRVRLLARGAGGAIEIHYHSSEALERIVEFLRGQEVRESNAL